METFLTGPNLLLLGLMIWAGMMLRSSAARSQTSTSRGVSEPVSSQLRAKQQFAESEIRELEVWLSDCDRNLTARVDRTLSLLDRWIEEADREIFRLETLLAERQANETAPLSLEQTRMVVQMAAAGYSNSQIAKLIDRPVAVVEEILVENRRAA